LRRSVGVDLHTFLVRRRTQHQIVSDVEKLHILGQLAAGMLHLHSNGYNLQDLHPFNVIIESRRPGLHLEIIDLDSLRRSPGRCRCWGPHVRYIFNNTPEALKSCGKPVCDGRGLVYLLGQFGRLLTLPEASSLMFSGMQRHGGPPRVSPRIFREATSLPEGSEPWLKNLVSAALREDPSRRPHLREIVAHLQRLKAIQQVQDEDRSTTAPVLPFATFGYHLKRGEHETDDRMATRWQMIGAEIARDGIANETTFAVDWGSNQGYFSVALAYAFPRMHVFSVDSNDFYFGVKSQDVHRQRNAEILQSSQLSRTMLCQGYLSVNAINSFSQPLDYQLALSIFHWLPLRTKDEFHRTLGQFLAKARTTFLELPEAGHEGSAHAKAYLHWYSPSEPMAEVIRSALETTDTLYTVRYIGNSTIAATRRASATTRQLFRIDVLAETVNRTAGTLPIAVCSDLKHAINCSNDPCLAVLS